MADRNFKYLFHAAFLAAALSIVSFGQSELKPRKFAFNPISDSVSTSKSTEPTRPRRIIEAARAEAPTTDSGSAPVAPQPTFKANTILVKSTSGIAEVERSVFDLLNRKRGELGLLPIAWNDDMARIARLHSENMAKHKFFSHTGLDGLMVNDRADSLGITNWQAIGENIAFLRGFDKPAEVACEKWMLSPTHRDNILSPRWKETGLGVAVTDDGTYYLTQVFVVR